MAQRRPQPANPNTEQELNLLARDQFLSNALAGVRNGPVVATDELDLHPRRKLLFVLLQVKVDALLHFIARLGEKSRIAVDQTDLDGLR